MPLPRDDKKPSSNLDHSISNQNQSQLESQLTDSFDQSQTQGEESQMSFQDESQVESQLESESQSQSQIQTESQSQEQVESHLTSSTSTTAAAPKKRKRKSLPARRWSGLGGGASSFSWDPRSSTSNRRKKGFKSSMDGEDQDKDKGSTIETSIEALSERVEGLMDKLCLLGVISDGLGLDSLFKDDNNQESQSQIKESQAETQIEDESQTQMESQQLLPPIKSKSTTSASKEPILFGSASRPKEIRRDDRDEIQWLCSDLVEPYFSKTLPKLCEIMRGKCYIPSTTPARPKYVRVSGSDNVETESSKQEEEEENLKEGSSRSGGLSRSKSFPSNPSSTPNLKELSISNQNRKLQANRKALESLPNFNQALNLEKHNKEKNERKKWEDERLKLKETLKKVGEDKKERKLKRSSSVGIGAPFGDNKLNMKGKVNSNGNSVGTGVGIDGIPRISKRKTEARKLPISGANLGAPFSTSSSSSNPIKNKTSTISKNQVSTDQDGSKLKVPSFDSRTSILASPQKKKEFGGIGVTSKALARGRNLSGIKRSESQPNPEVFDDDDDDEDEQSSRRHSINSQISASSKSHNKRKPISLSEDEDEDVNNKSNSIRGEESQAKIRRYSSNSTSFQKPTLPIKQRSAFSRSESQPTLEPGNVGGRIGKPMSLGIRSGSLAPVLNGGRSKMPTASSSSRKSENQPIADNSDSDEDEELETFEGKTHQNEEDEEDEEIVVPKSRKSLSNSINFPWTSMNQSQLQIDDSQDQEMDSNSFSFSRPSLIATKSEPVSNQLEIHKKFQSHHTSTVKVNGGGIGNLSRLNRAPSGRNPFAKSSIPISKSKEIPPLLHSTSAPSVQSTSSSRNDAQNSDSDSLPLKGRKRIKLSPEVGLERNGELTPSELGRNWRAGRMEMMEEGDRN